MNPLAAPAHPLAASGWAESTPSHRIGLPAGYAPVDLAALAQGREPGSLGEGALEAGTHHYEGASHDPVMWHFGASYGLLEHHRPDLASLARFAHRIEVATFHMCAAFSQGGVRDFDIEVGRASPRAGERGGHWFAMLADSTFLRFRILRSALMHKWNPPAEVEPLTYSAFYSLCDLTPAAGKSLKLLFLRQRGRAVERLVSQLDLIAQQLEEAVDLAVDVDDVVADDSALDAEERLAANQAEVLSRAGEVLSLSEAAKRLGMSRQNLHKRVGVGSALGVVRGKDLIVPAMQFEEVGGRLRIVPDLRRVLSLFDDAGAGRWSALQFLTEVDPMVGGVPIERLKAGGYEAVVAAATAFLGLNEG